MIQSKKEAPPDVAASERAKMGAGACGVPTTSNHKFTTPTYRGQENAIVLEVGGAVE